MLWKGQRESQNVEDRRGHPIARGGAALGGGSIVLLLLISLLTGQNPLQLLSSMGVLEEEPQYAEQGSTGAPQDELGKFAAVVLADTEDTWNQLLPRLGANYREPRLVLFNGAVRSACGLGSAAVGPFYCPNDQRVYLDLSFFNELSRRFGAPGDFASAYVIAHEIGHHVQNLLGIFEKVGRARESMGGSGNQLSVLLELQADCFAGVWGYHAKQRGLIEPGDFEEGLRAAAAIGDDRLQHLGQGEVQPEAWTHGSSEQRSRWLRRGLESGNPANCNTFSGENISQGY